MREYKVLVEDKEPVTVRADYVQIKKEGVLAFYETSVVENDEMVHAFTDWKTFKML